MMMPAGQVTVPAHGSLSFAPGGYHLMIMGAKGLADGSTATVTLKFQRAGTVVVPFRVQAKIATARAASSTGAMPRMKMGQ